MDFVVERGVKSCVDMCKRHNKNKKLSFSGRWFLWPALCCADMDNSTSLHSSTADASYCLCVCVSLNQSFNNCCFTQKHSYLAAKQCGISAYSQSCPLAELSSTYGKSTCRDFCSHKWRSCPLLSKRWFLPRSPASNAQFTKSPLSRTLICPLLLHVERHPTAAFRFLLLSLSSLLLSLPPPRLWKRERADEPLCG